ncbi:MAG: hypothetical protein GC168_02190 [Candidatus Hydrogenedens sp.]|nr:hypothetical protein [Candidatus Hydrogenedens sp.]
MRFLKRLMNGVHLLARSMRIIWNDKTLMAFPLASTLCTLTVLWLIYISVGPDKVRLFINTRPDEIGVQHFNYGWYVMLALAYLALSFLTVFFNTAVVGCTYISMTQRDSKFMEGVLLSLKNLLSILLWSIFASTFGLLLSVLDWFKYTSRYTRKVLGSEWSMMTYFVLPVIEIENVTIFSAMGRSTRIMSDTWGEHATARFGMGLFFSILSLPALALLLFAYFYWGQVSYFIDALALSWVLFSLVLAQAAQSVLAVVLYLYATSGTPPEGWTGELLAKAFGKPVEEEAGEAA